MCNLVFLNIYQDVFNFTGLIGLTFFTPALVESSTGTVAVIFTSFSIQAPKEYFFPLHHDFVYTLVS